MLDNVGKNNALLGDLDGCLSEAERKLLGFAADDSRDRAMRARAEQLVEDDIATNQQHLPLSHTRSTDRKDLRPWQGKESDAEIMFNFESLTDAQDLYDFVLETQLVTPGEIKLKVHGEGAGAQYSVHFASNVLVQKPEVIQAAMIAYQDQLGEGEEEAYEDLAQDVDTVLAERAERKASPRGSAEPGSTGRKVDFNPYHDKAGVFTSREGLGDGGSWSDGKKRRLKATKKGAKLHFAGTKRPCGREARGKGKDIRCWDGKPGLGFKVAQALQKMQQAKRLTNTPMPNRKKEDVDAACAAIQEAWALYGIPLAFVGDTMLEASGAAGTVLGRGVRRVGRAISMGQVLAVAEAREKKFTPNAEQLAALKKWAEMHGAKWKFKLGAAWQRAAYPGMGDDGAYLQQVRNEAGPGWLAKFKLE